MATERPILMADRLVRAVLSGAKTQTRRPVCKATSFTDGTPWQRLEFDESKIPAGCPWTYVMPDYMQGAYLHVPAWPHPEDPPQHQTPEYWTRHRIVPRWDIGDRLWVREAWSETDATINEQPGVVYRATDPDWSSMEGFKWRPSIHMPRWACRLVLEITDVRVERVHQISDSAVVAEGIEQHEIDKYRKFLHPRDVHATAFSEAWNEHYGATDYRWQNNPWVWCISFRPAPTPGEAAE